MTEQPVVSTQAVSDLMTADPITIDAEAPAARAERLLEERHITGVPVVDGTGAVVGVLSRSDLLTRVDTNPSPPIGRASASAG